MVNEYNTYCDNQLWDFATDVFSQYTWDLMTETLKLYATWTMKDNYYRVSFNSSDISYVPSQTVVRGGKVTQPPAPTCYYENYVFDGWYKDRYTYNNVWNFDTDTVIENTTIYPKCIVGFFTVDFNTKGGSVVASQTVSRGGKATLPAPPTRTGYTFGGWYMDEAYTSVWNFASDVVSTWITLYAKWIDASVPTFTVTFNSQSGTAVNAQTIAQGEKVQKPNDPTRAGYVFGGWYKEASCTNAWNFASNTISANTTLYAKWTATSNGSDPTDPNNPTAVVAEALPKLSLYPNPASDVLYITDDFAGIVEVYDINGALILTSTGKDVDISSLPSGIYIVKAGNKVGKVVKR